MMKMLWMSLLTGLLGGAVGGYLGAKHFHAQRVSGVIAVPAMTAQMPDGTPVIAVVSIPLENVLRKNPAWIDFERQWPGKALLTEAKP